MTKRILILITSILFFSTLIKADHPIAPLPDHICLESNEGSLRIDTQARTYQLSMAGLVREGSLDRFIHLGPQGYIIATSQGETAFYCNFGLRRLIGFADVTLRDTEGNVIARSRITNPDQKDCEGNGPTGPPFEAHAVADRLEGEVPLTVNLSVVASEDLSRSNYLWQIGERTFATDPQTSISFDAPGVYIIQLTAVYEIEVARSSVTIKVLPKTDEADPIPPPANQPPSVAIRADQVTGKKPLRVTLTADAIDPDGQIISIAWSFSDGSKAQGMTFQRKYKKAGTFVETVTVMDNLGATTSASITITVGKKKT